MPVHSTWVGKLLTAGVFASAIATAPMAYAEGIPGDPGPAPQPSVSQPGGSGDCQSGESMDASGNCTPMMSAVPNTQGDDAFDDLQPRTTQDVTTTSDTGVGADLVPNINGTPCTGYWESAACYEASQGEVAVQPKSTLSSSP